jgi:AraC-like DNA-binding protein
MAPRAALEEPGAVHWDFPRSVAGVALVLEFAAEHGVGSATVLSGVDLDPRGLTEAGALVPTQVELAALRNLSQALPDRSALALELGRRYHVTSFGILGYALMSSRTVLDAMNLALRFIDLSHIFSRPVPSLEGDQVVIRLDTLGLPVGQAAFLVERDIAAIHTVLAELVPGGVPFASLDLEFAAPAHSPAYRDVLGVRPRFGRPYTALRFDLGHLRRPLPQANPHSQALAEAMCRDVVSERRAQPEVTDRVRLWITRNLARDAGLTSAAAALSLSPRTLRRRLAQAGTGYQALLDEVREALAVRMLVTGVLDVEDVAQRLGYAEASSFISAFKRWRGVTPAQFRRAELRRRQPAAAPGSAG